MTNLQPKSVFYLQFRGMSFTSMSDEYLLSCFDELCEMTAESRPNPEDWMDEWGACRTEILSRMRDRSDDSL